MWVPAFLHWRAPGSPLAVALNSEITNRKHIEKTVFSALPEPHLYLCVWQANTSASSGLSPLEREHQQVRAPATAEVRLSVCEDATVIIWGAASNLGLIGKLHSINPEIMYLMPGTGCSWVYGDWLWLFTESLSPLKSQKQHKSILVSSAFDTVRNSFFVMTILGQMK